MNRSAALALAVALTWSGLLVAAPPASSNQQVAPASQRTPGSSVTFTRGRTFVVTTQVGRRTVRGTGRVPEGLSTARVTARPARDVLGSGAPEVLLDFGRIPGDPSARAHGVFTVHRGKLRPVVLDRYPIVLVTATEGGDDAGFRCAKGRLQLHWYHHGTAQGERTSYVLTGTRLVEESRTPLTRPADSRPGTCG